MPIYEYICEDCGYIFSELVLHKDKQIVCPKCKSKNIKRKTVYSNSLKFIGSGFYVNDYKGK